MIEHVVLIRRFYGQKSSLISPSKWSIGFVSYRSLDPASGDSTSLICASCLGAVPSLDVCVMSSGSIRFSIASLWGIHSRILLCRLLSVWRQDSHQHFEQAMLRDCIPDNRCLSHLEVFEGIQFTEYWNIHPARSCPLLISSLGALGQSSDFDIFDTTSIAVSDGMCQCHNIRAVLHCVVV